ncbi:MAG TPA: DUF4232 domain-containing protein [Acidimicrobiales bacterium]|nr:DUF4232 domain-containing protein [Acidimicrobiales bacterium]
MRTGTVGAVALTVSLVCVCSACGAGSPPSHGKHHSQSTTTTAPPPRPTTSTTSAGAAPARCTFAQLSISLGQSGAGLGHEGGTVLFKNVGTAECTLSGYPGVAALDSRGTQVEQARRDPGGYLGGLQTGSTTPPVVVLEVGAVASAMVEGTDVPVGTATSCPTYPALLVTPPTSTQSRRVTLSLPGCSPLQVHPVVPGTTGSTR